MKTLKQIRNDKRVCKVTDVSNQDFNDGIKYEISLNDGYVFDKDLMSALEYAHNIKELNEILEDIVEV